MTIPWFILLLLHHGVTGCPFSATPKATKTRRKEAETTTGTAEFSGVLNSLEKPVASSVPREVALEGRGCVPRQKEGGCAHCARSAAPWSPSGTCTARWCGRSRLRSGTGRSRHSPSQKSPGDTLQHKQRDGGRGVKQLLWEWKANVLVQCAAEECSCSSWNGEFCQRKAPKPASCGVV